MGLVLGTVDWGGLWEKGEGVTMGGNGRGEAGEVAGDGCLRWMALGKGYGTFSGWEMAIGKVEVYAGGWWVSLKHV